MRLYAALMFAVLTLSAPAKAEEPALTFNAPPADVPDFQFWSDPRKTERVLTPGTAGPTLAYEFRRAGLCRADEPACKVTVRVEEYAQNRCISQNDQEYDCRRRMAWKSMTTVQVVVRFVMSRGDTRVEGLAYEDENKFAYFFTRKEDGWHEITSAVDEREYELQKSLFVLLVKLPNLP